MSKTINKVLESKDGSKHPYSYEEPESLEEAVKMFGTEVSLRLLLYALGVSERRKAVPTASDLMDLLKSDPELKALYEQKLAEKRAALKTK